MGRIITHTYLLKHWLQSGHKHVTNSKCLTSHGTSMETKEQEKLRSLYLLRNCFQHLKFLINQYLEYQYQSQHHHHHQHHNPTNIINSNIIIDIITTIIHITKIHFALAITSIKIIKTNILITTIHLNTLTLIVITSITRKFCGNRDWIFSIFYVFIYKHFYIVVVYTEEL